MIRVYVLVGQKSLIPDVISYADHSILFEGRIHGFEVLLQESHLSIDIGKRLTAALQHFPGLAIAHCSLSGAGMLHLGKADHFQLCLPLSCFFPFLLVILPFS